ncbi:MAG: ABC transporter ATP-binding protein [Gemmatimonadota bacterium]|nr:ABC transporter ATP-binding protein [Gemmatimonadota bacterium]
MTMSLPAARLASVTKKYGDKIALRDVSLDIGPGGVIALLGPNGAGKTTTVKLLLGLVPPTSGSVSLFGNDPRNSSARRNIGAMLQVGKVPETLRVREHIDLFRSYYPSPMPADEVYVAAGLEGLEESKFGDLSGGQRQRVLFALAICGNPQMLFLDEPTLGFDVEARRSFWEQIRAFVARGRTVLLTTHYLEEADALADRIIVIDHGSVIADGTPAQIKERVAGRKIRCTTALTEAELRAISGVTDVRFDRGNAELVVTNAESVARELLFTDATLSNLEISGVQLEEAFLALTHAGEAA